MSEKFKPQPGDVIEVRNDGKWESRIFVRMKGCSFECFFRLADTNPCEAADSCMNDYFFDWRQARPAIPVSVTPLTKPLSDLQQQWLDLCPEFDTDNYEYEIGHDMKDIGGAEFWTMNNAGWAKAIRPYHVCLRRPKPPTFKLGEKFSFEGKNCMYVLMDENKEFRHSRLNLDNMTVEDSLDTYTHFCNYHQSAIRGEG